MFEKFKQDLTHYKTNDRATVYVCTQATLCACVWTIIVSLF